MNEPLAVLPDQNLDFIFELSQIARPWVFDHLIQNGEWEFVVCLVLLIKYRELVF